MIIHWKKRNAGVLVLPCMQGRTRVKVIYILPGHNDVPTDDWMMARTSAKRHIADGVLVELAEEKKVVVQKKVKKPKKAAVVKQDVNYLTLETFPFKEVVTILKSEKMFDAISEQKKEETTAKNLSKQWLIDYMSEVKEDWEVVLSKLSADAEPSDEDEEDEFVDEETGEVEITALTLSEIDSNQATDIIADTWDLRTLEKWKKEISQPDLRVLIINQIDEVNAPPKNKGNK